MKNVTGYDLVKLSAGAFGTLGVLTELSFKLSPRPEAARTLRLGGLDDAAAVAALCAALGSPFDVSGAAHDPAGEDGAPLTLVRVEGFETSVAYRAARLRDLLAPHGEAEIDEDPERVAETWRRIRDVAPFAGRPGAVWRCSVKPTDGPALVASLRRREAVEAALYDWGGGLVWLLAPETEDAGAGAIRRETAALGGHATLVRARAETRARVAPFHPERRSRALGALRPQFDPAESSSAMLTRIPPMRRFRGPETRVHPDEGWLLLMRFARHCPLTVPGRIEPRASSC
jgi:FAD/FMN-containing dehydrogenases